jgi:hypothetical protein
MASPQEKNGMNGYSNGNSNGNSNGKGKHAAAPQARPKTQAQPEEKKEGVVKSFKKLRVLSKRPLPREMGDGSYRVVDTRPGLKQDVRRLRGKDLKTLFEIVRSKVKGEMQQDDKTMLMERTIQLVANLSDHSKVQEALTNSFIAQLWNSIDHPPMLYMGDKFRFRQPDGSNNVS